MSNSKFLKYLTKTINNHNNDFNNVILKFNEFHEDAIIKSNEELILLISKEYNLEYSSLINKFIKPKKKNLKNKKTFELIDDSDSDDSNEDSDININNLVLSNSTSSNNILEKKKLNNIEYFCDNKEGGNVYNSECKNVGKIINGEIQLFT